MPASRFENPFGGCDMRLMMSSLLYCRLMIHLVFDGYSSVQALGCRDGSIGAASALAWSSARWLVSGSRPYSSFVEGMYCGLDCLGAR